MLILTEKFSAAKDSADALRAGKSVGYFKTRNIFNPESLESHHALIPFSPLPASASVEEKTCPASCREVSSPPTRTTTDTMRKHQVFTTRINTLLHLSVKPYGDRPTPAFSQPRITSM